MNRRTFLETLIAIPLAALVPKFTGVVASGKCIALLHSPVSLYGIPYHQSNASTGGWLGFSREGHLNKQPSKELIELIKTIQMNKKENPILEFYY